MLRDILSGRDDHNKVFRRGDPHFRRLQLLVDLLANTLFCTVDRVLAEKPSHSCIN